MSHQYYLLILSVIALSLFTYTTSSKTYYSCSISGDPHYRMFGNGQRYPIHHYSGVARNTLVTSSVFDLQFNGKKCGSHGRGIDENGDVIQSTWNVSADGSHARSGPTCMSDYYMALRLNPNCPHDTTHVLVYDKVSKKLKLNGHVLTHLASNGDTDKGPHNNEPLGTLELEKMHYGFAVTLNYLNKKIIFEMGLRHHMTIKVKHDVQDTDYMSSASGLCGVIGSMDLPAKDGETKSIPAEDINDWHARWLGRSPSKWRDDNTFLSSWHVKESDPDWINYVAENVNTADATECLVNAPPPLNRNPAPSALPATTPSPTPSLSRTSFHSLSDDADAADNDGPDCSDIDTMVAVTDICAALQRHTDDLEDDEIEAGRDAMALCILDMCAGADESVATGNVVAFAADMDEVHPKPRDPLPFIISGTVALSGLVAFVIAFVHHRHVANQHKKQLMILDPRLQQQAATANML